MRWLLIALAVVSPTLARGESRAAQQERKQQFIKAIDNCEMEESVLFNGAEESLPLVCAAIPKKKARDRRCLLGVVETMFDLSDRHKIGFSGLRRAYPCDPALLSKLISDKDDETAATAMNLFWRINKFPGDEDLLVVEANLKRPYLLARLYAARALVARDVTCRGRNWPKAKFHPEAVGVLADLVAIDENDPVAAKQGLNASKLREAATEEILKAEEVPSGTFPAILARKENIASCEALAPISDAARRHRNPSRETIARIEEEAMKLNCGDLTKSPNATLRRPVTELGDGYVEGGAASPGDDFSLTLGCKKKVCDRVYLRRVGGRNFYGEAFWDVVDVLQVPAFNQKVESVLIEGGESCRLNGRPDRGLVALARNELGPELKAIRMAWRANTATGKIEPIPTEGIVCNTECPGMACPW